MQFALKVLGLSWLFVSSVTHGTELPGEFSGEVQAFYRYFNHPGDYGNTDQNQFSLVFKPEYTNAWDNDRNVITVEPFIRLDSLDNERTHGDIRELSYVSSWDTIELRVGISKVFWGVAESQHLVDIINQTDLVENPDGEQKLGQPMINTTFVTNSGNYAFFILPYFRERTFAGADDRYRGIFVIDADNAEYTHEKQNKHVDYAFRWSHYWDDFEWAVSYFNGTDREPIFRFNPANNQLTPIYGQSEQTGLELQYIYKDLLLKGEMIHKQTDTTPTYFASTVGFEYTIYSVFNRADIGLLYEWLYDDRDQNTPTGFYDASFIGTRLALNDEASSELLIGAIFNNDDSEMMLFRVEASRRINQNLSIDLEVNIIGTPPQNSVLEQFRNDDYVEMSVAGYY